MSPVVYVAGVSVSPANVVAPLLPEIPSELVATHTIPPAAVLDACSTNPSVGEPVMFNSDSSMVWPSLEIVVEPNIYEATRALVKY